MSKRLSTRQILIEIPNVPCLYRHKINGRYYGLKKIGRKRKEHALGTTDRKVAERFLKKWINDLERLDPAMDKISLGDLLGKFQLLRKGFSKSTRDTEDGMINKLKRTWRHGLDLRLSEVKPSMLDEWMAQQESKLKNSSYNRYGLFLKQLFEIALADKMIAESPVAGMQRTWKRPQKPDRKIPTPEQLDLIVDNMRSQRFNAEAEESSDFIGFMGKAGLGQAEVSSLAVPNMVVFVLGCVLILAALRVNFVTGPVEPTLNKTRDNPPPPVMPPLPDFVTRYVYHTNEVERVEFEIEPGRLSAQGIDDFLRLARMTYGTVNQTSQVFQAEITIKNTDTKPILLDLDDRFFSLEDDQGHSGKLIYFSLVSWQLRQSLA